MKKNIFFTVFFLLIIGSPFSGYSQNGEKPYGFAGDAENLTFRIQIAASVEPIELSTLRKIYPREVNIINEKDGVWYKYLIGNYKTYRDAWEAGKEIKVKGAFIVAYRDGKRVSNIREVAQPIK